MAKEKKKRKKRNPYFGEEQEQAVVDYIKSDCQEERSLIYSQYLHAPLNKMVESIINRYKLHRKGISFEELHADTLSYLMMKADMFKPDKNKKAYSYYGTIIKNRLLQNLLGDDKKMKRNLSYEDVHSTLEKDESLSYEMEDPNVNPLADFIVELIDWIKLDMNDPEVPPNDNEKKVGEAMIYVLKNWENLHGTMGDNNKYNKMQFLADVREYTHLDNKEIRDGIKRYKELFFSVKKDKILKDEL